MTRRPIIDGLLAGFVHVLWRDQHDGLGGRAAALIDGERDGRGADIVGQVDDDVGVDAAEGEVEGLRFPPNPSAIFAIAERRPVPPSWATPLTPAAV